MNSIGVILNYASTILIIKLCKYSEAIAKSVDNNDEFKSASRHVREPHANRFASISLMEHDLEHEIWFRLQLLISLRFRVLSKKVRKKLSCSRLELRSICRFLHAERDFSLGDWIIKPNSVNTLMNRMNFRQTSLSLRRPVDLKCKDF